jgi:hypothetical protein
MTKFSALLFALSDAQVNFVVVGGYAAMLRGSAYLTQDLDICYERTAENLQRLASALGPLHPRLRGAPEGMPFVFDERTLLQGMNFTLETDAGDLDLLGELSGVGGYPMISKSAESMEVNGRSYRVASLEELIRSKRAAGRPKDLNVLPELEALRDLNRKRQP